MEETIKEIITNLNEIQNDLAGIIIPVLITSIVSTISIIATIISKTTSENKTINVEQFEIMQKIYLPLRLELYELKISIAKFSKNKLYENFDSSIIKYAIIKSDEKAYRNKYPNHVNFIDDFNLSAESIIQKIITINKYLSSNKMPYIPFYHPLLKYKRKKMIGTLHYYSLHLNKYINKEIDAGFIANTFNRKCKNKLTENILKGYINFIDKWYLIY